MHVTSSFRIWYVLPLIQLIIYLHIVFIQLIQPAVATCQWNPFVSSCLVWPDHQKLICLWICSIFTCSNGQYFVLFRHLTSYSHKIFSENSESLAPTCQQRPHSHSYSRRWDLWKGQLFCMWQKLENGITHLSEQLWPWDLYWLILVICSYSLMKTAWGQLSCETKSPKTDLFWISEDWFWYGLYIYICPNDD